MIHRLACKGGTALKKDSTTRTNVQSTRTGAMLVYTATTGMIQQQYHDTAA